MARLGNNRSSDIAQMKQQVSGVFDRAATTYEHIGPRFFSHFGRRLVELIQMPIGATVLDAATGRGAVLFPAAEFVGTQGHVTGIDFSEMMVRETAREIAHLGALPNTEVHQMDAENLQFPDKSFDYVLCSFAIPFFPQTYLALSEFRRVLNPKGRIGVVTWDKALNEYWRFDEIVKAYLSPEPEANQETKSNSLPQPVFDTQEGLRAMIDAAGFIDIQVISETAEFIYANKEEFWSTLWSHGMRGTLEKVEQVTGSDGLRRFKADVFKKAEAIKKTDGIHQLFPALFTLATKPS